MPARDREQLHAETAEQWRTWLAGHADRGAGVWVVTWKTATGRPRPTYDELVLEALTQGWVDSMAGTVDEDRAILWFAPRKRGSGWSRPNKLRIALLVAEGRMQPRGAAVFAAAKADGSWTLLDVVENLVVPTADRRRARVLSRTCCPAQLLTAPAHSDGRKATVRFSGAPVRSSLSAT